MLWANLHLLFWLSLMPFATGWMGENHFAPMTVSLYGVVLFMTGVAYLILARTLTGRHNLQSEATIQAGANLKLKVSMVLYLAGISLAFVNEWISLALYASVAVIWFIPDRRFEQSHAAP